MLRRRWQFSRAPAACLLNNVSPACPVLGSSSSFLKSHIPCWSTSVLVYLCDGDHVCIHDGVCHFPFELHGRSTSICDSVKLRQCLSPCLICVTLRSCWMSRTTSCSAIHCTIQLTHCIHSPHSPLRSTTTWDDRRIHDWQLLTQISHLCDKNFLGRALYKDSYWICTLCIVHAVRFYTPLSSTAVCQFC